MHCASSSQASREWRGIVIGAAIAASWAVRLIDGFQAKRGPCRYLEIGFWSSAVMADISVKDACEQLLAAARHYVEFGSRIGEVIDRPFVALQINASPTTGTTNG